MSNASLSFLPWVRQSAASAITVADTLGAGQHAVADIAAALTLNGAPVPGIAVRLRGPADVIGIDPNQIVRTDPRPATTDFEPNCFPSIEFDRPDFPWLFTPASANANARLRPWLCLVVVRRQSGVTLTSTPGTPLPALHIAAPAQPAVELPDLAECWAWAHAQAAADDGTPQAIEAALNGSPELALSRLVCPRILAPDTDYIACVVPAFDLGRKAGLGLPIADADLVASNALAPAWLPKATAVVLPVYFQWEFRTGQGGDFESLARRLKPTLPDGLGKRRIDISHPGFPAGGARTLDMEGALLPIAPPVNPPPPAPVPLAFQTTLAKIINEPSRTEAANPKADPLLAPPTYGRWHAGKSAVTPNGPAWLDQLNLDPRWRVAAAFGTRVIQEHQEALMASAWEQAADMPAANQRMRQLQLSMAVGEILHEKHIQRLSEEMVLRIAAPAFGRLRQENGRFMLAEQAGSVLPVAATRSAMRRIGRQRGPLTRRITAQGYARSPGQTWVALLNNMATPAEVLPPPPPPVFNVMPTLPFLHLQADSFFGAFFVAPENAAVTFPAAPVLVTGLTELPGFFRAAAGEHLDRFFVAHPAPIHTNFIIFQDIKDPVVEQTRPSVALVNLLSAVLSTGDDVLSPTAPGVSPIGVETVMTAPAFPQPMYEALRDLSQDLLLPGLDKVKPDTVLGLQTNRRFVESYMVGLNHEMGRELLWRGYPTDQRGTYFAHFWGQGVPNAAPANIADLNTWAQRRLGDTAGAPATEAFVMLMRSSLLRRYPNAVIYLTPAVLISTNPLQRAPNEDPGSEKMPIFSGSMQPDVVFFGFPVATAEATGSDGGPGWFVVIQEHPTEPRFGLDAGTQLGTASHLAIGAGPPTGLNLNGRIWGKNAAEMAGITRRLPVRLAIHASMLITHA